MVKKKKNHKKNQNQTKTKTSKTNHPTEEKANTKSKHYMQEWILATSKREETLCSTQTEGKASLSHLKTVEMYGGKHCE